MTIHQAKQLINDYERGLATEKELNLSLYQSSGNARREIIQYLLNKEDK